MVAVSAPALAATAPGQTAPVDGDLPVPVAAHPPAPTPVDLGPLAADDASDSGEQLITQP
jgi:hypothetical protein